MKKLSIFITASAVSLFLLTGCLVPERFVAKVDVQSDASYTFRYSGTAVDAIAAGRVKQSGALSNKEEEGYRNEAAKFTKNPEIRKATYKGSGKYELEIETQKQAGQSMKMFDIFFVKTDNQGVITISTEQFDDKAKIELAKLGITINGTLEVHLPKNAEIISHNAQSTPIFGFGSYTWKIGQMDQRPTMKIRIK